MIISSRTPEGLPNRCPLCGKRVIIEPSRPFGDAPCPHCGHLLFFLNTPDEVRLASEPKATSLRERVLAIVGAAADALGWLTGKRSVRERVLATVAEQLGVSRDQVTEKSFVNDLAADSLDNVELIMELEEEFDE